MNKVVESAPGIIEEAAKSPLGIFALMILAISVLGFFFFRKASERTRTTMFILLVVGVAVFGFAAFRQVPRGGSGSGDPTSAGGGPQPGTDGVGGTAPEGGIQAPSEPSQAIQVSLSTDRDNPTRLTSNRIRGTGTDRGRVQYFCSFRGGPGEVKVTFDFTFGGTDGSAEVTLFDEDFTSIENLYLGGNKGDSARKVGRIQLSNEQIVIVGLDLNSRSGAAGSFLLGLEGAVQF